MLTVRSRKYKRVGKQTCSKDKLLHKNRTVKSQKSCNKTLKGGSGRGAGGRTAMSQYLDAKILEFLEIYNNIDEYDYVGSTTEKKRTMLSSNYKLKKSDPFLSLFKKSDQVKKLYDLIQTRKLKIRLSDIKGKSMAMPVEYETKLTLLLAQVMPVLDEYVKKYPWLKSTTAEKKHSMLPSVPSHEPGEGLKFPSPPKSFNKTGITMDPEYVKFATLLMRNIDEMRTNYRPAILNILTDEDKLLILQINDKTLVNSKQKKLIPAIGILTNKLLTFMEDNEDLKLKK